MEFVAPTTRHGKCDVTLTDAGQLRRQVVEVPGD
jgi:hypothetical protein